jgi:GNAT superfamily N-acetyltransferase
MTEDEQQPAVREEERAELADSQDGVVIRTATGNDLDAVVRVGHRTWLATYEPIAGPDYVAMGLAKWWTTDAIIPSIRVGRTLVAEQDGEVVAMAAYGTQGEDLVLWKLYVLPEHHGHGIGRRLLASVVDRALELGHTRLVVSHTDGNEQGNRFYERNGFRFTERESGGSGMPDTIWLVKDLSVPKTLPEESRR